MVEIEEPGPGGIKGAALAVQKAWKQSPVVNSTKSWLWYLFKKSGTITWVVTSTSLIVLLPLILEVKADMLMAEGEKIAQLQAQVS